MQFPQLLSNTLNQWFAFFLLLALAVIFNKLLGRLLEGFILRLYSRKINAAHATIFKEYLSSALRIFIVLLIMAAAFEVLQFPSAFNIKIFEVPLHLILERAFFAVLLFSFFRVLLRATDFISYLLKERAQISDSKIDDQLVVFLRDVTKAILLVSFLLLVLGVVFDLNITSLLAGVGIGGLAVAFAAQESIKDLFGSVTIFLDRPFKLGDLVSIDDAQGTVEKVGIRSTRIRTSDKTFMTIPNKKMLETNVNNYTLRTYRKVVQTLGFYYETDPEILKAALDEIKKFIAEDAIFKNDEFTITLNSFGENSMNVLLEYYIPPMPYVEYLQQRERMNFKLLEILKNYKIKLAYPVRDIRGVKDY